MDTQFTKRESSTSKFSYSPHHWNYDVFLSFRGKDTRKGFIGHLYFRLDQVGVKTFIDDEELRKGDVISKELEKAIEESRISIVVFSKDYASSSWCLDELVKIVECKEKLKQMVLPIFYDVDPSQVRWQNGVFGEALANHKKHFEVERIEKWMAALSEAANLSGWDLQNVANGHESKFIESFVQEVLQEVKQTPLDVACRPVGLETRLKDIEQLLHNAYVDEVRMVGIYGVGGIGKTTLAKAIYNQIFRQFDGSCFLPDVRSEAETIGLVKLQENLLHQILKTKDIKVNCVAEGVNLIKARFASKKILIILDDLDHTEQLQSLARDRNWFGSGSLIVITTRDKQLLCGLKENERYEAKLLNDNEAMELFNYHAFNSDFPPEEYVELAHDITKYSGQLPLALATLGSHLQGRSVGEWRYEFQKLRAIPHSDILKILKISFDGLDSDVQSVFLDIACVFHKFSKYEVSNALNACGFYFESAISTLIRKCLLNGPRSCLMMHDLIRDMGIEIVRMESPQDPGRRSRLFDPQEVRDVLLGNKGSKKLEVLTVDPRALAGMDLSTKAFKKMKNLRVLIMDELHISGDFELLPKELRWLSWQKCPLKYIPSNFPAVNLVVLNMGGSDIREFGLNLQCCKSLKKLDLSYCSRLKITPNFIGSRSLETLLLNDCSSLTEIHQSIGSLDRLTVLLLSGCGKLKDLPSSICQLKSLKFLSIQRCLSIQTLPVGLGDLRNLDNLYARDTSIRELPESVELLRNITVLEVGGGLAKRSFSQRRVPHIQSLSTSLRSLSLRYCGLSETDIPGDIGSLSSLQVLDLSGNSFHCLPFNFSKLRFLRYLYLDNCENLQTIPSLSNLEDIEKISLVNCKKLAKITESDNLPSIDRINMVSCSSLHNPFNEIFFSAPALACPSREHLHRQELYIDLHCNEIPDWCRNQVTGWSICFTMPTHNESQFLGIVLWCVRKFVNFPRFPQINGMSFSIAERMSSFWWNDYELPAGYVEVSSVVYKSYLQSPFDGQLKGGEKVQVLEWGVDNTVKKIGIHLLYSDQQGKVTSLPAVVGHSDQIKGEREINEREKADRQMREECLRSLGINGVSTGQNAASEGRFRIWSYVSSLVRFFSRCFS